MAESADPTLPAGGADVPMATAASATHVSRHPIPMAPQRARSSHSHTHPHAQPDGAASASAAAAVTHTAAVAATPAPAASPLTLLGGRTMRDDSGDATRQLPSAAPPAAPNSASLRAPRPPPAGDSAMSDTQPPAAPAAATAAVSAPSDAVPDVVMTDEATGSPAAPADAAPASGSPSPATSAAADTPPSPSPRAFIAIDDEEQGDVDEESPLMLATSPTRAVSPMDEGEGMDAGAGTGAGADEGAAVAPNHPPAECFCGVADLRGNDVICSRADKPNSRCFCTHQACLRPMPPLGSARALYGPPLRAPVLNFGSSVFICRACIGYEEPDQRFFECVYSSPDGRVYNPLTAPPAPQTSPTGQREAVSGVAGTQQAHLAAVTAATVSSAAAPAVLSAPPSAAAPGVAVAITPASACAPISAPASASAVDSVVTSALAASLRSRIEREGPSFVDLTTSEMTAEASLAVKRHAALTLIQSLPPEARREMAHAVMQQSPEVHAHTTPTTPALTRTPQSSLPLAATQQQQQQQQPKSKAARPLRPLVPPSKSDPLSDEVRTVVFLHGGERIALFRGVAYRPPGPRSKRLRLQKERRELEEALEDVGAGAQELEEGELVDGGEERKETAATDAQPRIKKRRVNPSSSSSSSGPAAHSAHHPSRPAAASAPSPAAPCTTATAGVPVIQTSANSSGGAGLPSFWCRCACESRCAGLHPTRSSSAAAPAPALAPAIAARFSSPLDALQRRLVLALERSDDDALASPASAVAPVSAASGASLAALLPVLLPPLRVLLRASGIGPSELRCMPVSLLHLVCCKAAQQARSADTYAAFLRHFSQAGFDSNHAHSLDRDNGAAAAATSSAR